MKRNPKELPFMAPYPWAIWPIGLGVASLLVVIGTLNGRWPVALLGTLLWVFLLMAAIVNLRTKQLQ